jgi:hypothetical protein
MAESSSNIPHAHAPTIVEKTKDLAAAIEQKVVDKFGLDPAKKSVEQQLTDEFGTNLSEKSLKQIFRDKLSSDAEGRSTGERVHRSSLAMQDVVHRAVQDSVKGIRHGHNGYVQNG